MEQLEPLDEALREAESVRDEAGHRLRREREELARADAAVVQELAPAQAHRDAMAAHVPDDLLEVYAKLRERFGGQGAAWLDGSRCTGCRLTMSPAEVDAFHRQSDDEVRYCESCGRILVPR